jgi:hypothetical protein
MIKIERFLVSEIAEKRSDAFNFRSTPIGGQSSSGGPTLIFIVMDPTAAAYQGLPKVNKPFYDKLRTSDSRQLIQEFTIPIRTGQVWKVTFGIKIN